MGAQLLTGMLALRRKCSSPLRRGEEVPPHCYATPSAFSKPSGRLRPCPPSLPMHVLLGSTSLLLLHCLLSILWSVALVLRAGLDGAVAVK